MLEDDKGISTVIGNIFFQKLEPPFIVELKETLKEALESMSKITPDVILMDLGLPDSQGLNTFHRVHDHSPGVPIVVMTANHDEAYTMEAIRKGAQDYLVKGTFDAKILPRVLSFAIERKRSERELRSAEEKYRTIFENSAVAIIVANSVERIVSWNKFTEALLGMQAEDLHMKPVSSLYPEEEWKKIRSYDIRRKGKPHQIESQMIRKNGSVFDVEVGITVLKDPDGNITGSIGITKDITERKMAERAIRSAEARYRTIFENSAVGITVTDADERIISWNKFTENLLGMTHEDLYLKPVSSLYPPEEWQRMRAANIRHKGVQDHFETRILNKQDEKVDIDISISVLKDNEGQVTGSIGIIRDITERRQLEAEKDQKQKELQDAYNKLGQATQMLVQTEKMSAVGMLAAGTAHELNNPMMGIVNYIEYCRKHTAEDDRRYPVLQDAEREVKRCIKIIKDLLALAHTDSDDQAGFEQETCDEIMDRVIRLTSFRVQQESVTLEDKRKRDTRKIWMKSDDVEQVLLNLTVNALDAMRGAEHKELSVDVRQEGDWVETIIEDSGCGIPENSLSKIFNPFYTTKPEGEGTGLGLSVSQSIIRNMGGRIECESEPGKGTVFRVYLPLGAERSKSEQTNPGD
ncbi:MAG: PAS domain S-box protein [Candidatus Omnitrophota bacterium]|nr:PAS domain S-box protein [Candidatus Omnitrophota bacterium]